MYSIIVFHKHRPTKKKKNCEQAIQTNKVLFVLCWLGLSQFNISLCAERQQDSMERSDR